MPIRTPMGLILRIGAVLFPIIFIVSLLGCPMQRHTEVLTGPYPDGDDRTNPAPISTPRFHIQSLNLPMRFEANQGQMDLQADFISRGSGYMLFLTRTEAVMVLMGNGRPERLKERPEGLEEREPEGSLEDRSARGKNASSEAILKRSDPQAKRSSSEAVSAERSFSMLRMKLVGANPSAKGRGVEELPGITNYLIGDPSRWRTGIPSYKEVECRDIYPGIDLIYYGTQRQLEYDFVVAPGADPELITLSFEGHEKLRIDENGDLVLEMAEGNGVRFHKPHIYQELNGVRRPIQGRYIIKNGREKISNSEFRIPNSEFETPHSSMVGFKVAAYDRKSPLVIDPTTSLSFSTYLGGTTASDIAYSIAVDSSNNVYVTGTTSSTDFPTTTSFYQSKYTGGAGHVFVTKLNSDGQSLVYSTYLGGTLPVGGAYVDTGNGIAVGSGGYAYVTGYTYSSDFPTKSGAYQTTRPWVLGYRTAFVTKLNSDGQSLVYSTYLSGSAADTGRAIAVDTAGNAYVTGSTNSTDFPTKNPYQSTCNNCIPNTDLFVTKLNSDGKTLIYSTYLGGSNSEQSCSGSAKGEARGNSLAVDSSGYVYVTGCTASTDFPTTANAFQQAAGGGSDAFVTKLNTDGHTLIYSTYLGGTNGDGGFGIAVDPYGSAFVTGNTQSGSNFPTTSGAYQTSANTAAFHAFVTRLNTAGTDLIYSTFLASGGSSTSYNDYGLAIARDSGDYAYVTGATSMTNFPTTSGAYQTKLNNAVQQYDAFLALINTNDTTGSGLSYSTYFGGSNADSGYGLVLDTAGNIYVTGTTNSTNFPTTANAYQTAAPGGAGDAFVFKFSAFSPTAVKLSSFTATGEGSRVKVEWVTKTEIDNRGFNLYRSTEKEGTYVKLNREIISGLLSSASGRSYNFYDDGLIQGQLYYYKLEDIDLGGKKTLHGPVCIDWNGNGVGDDVDPNRNVYSSDVIGKGGGSVSGSGWSSSGGSGNFILPGFAGKTVTQVLLRDLRAFKTDQGVLVEWRTGFEVNNLGFNVYRQEGDQLLKLTPELIAGSALLAGAGTTTAGFSYSWLDNAAISQKQGSRERESARAQGVKLSPQSSALSTVLYWVEDVDLSGKRTWHGPVSPVSSGELPKRSQAALLSHLTKQQLGQDPSLSRLQSLQTRLGKNQHSGFRSPPPPPSPLKGEGTGGGASALKARSSLLAPRSSNIMVRGVDDGNGSFPEGQIPPGMSDRPPPDPVQVQIGLAASQGVKIFLQKEGWYRITQPELLAAGLNPSVNPTYLQLFVDGQEQAMRVNTEEDGSFDPQDSVEFYGTGLDTPFTDTRVYWLAVGRKPGKRINFTQDSALRTQHSALMTQSSSLSFPFTVEDKPRTIYFAGLLNGDADNFFGPIVSQTAVERVVTVSHLDPSPPGGATLDVALQGVTLVPHGVTISLNDVEVGSLTFDGQTRGVTAIPLSQAALLQGDNRITLTAQGGEMDVSLIDSIRLTYWHTYSADEDTLRFTSASGKQLLVDNFSNSQIRVVDITDPGMVEEIRGVVNAQGSGYAIQFEADGSGERTLLAFTEDKIEKPAALEANAPSDWRRAGLSADLIIISHADFLDSLQPLKSLREAQGLSVVLIDVEDLYDEFSFGVKNPQAIKDFLTRANSKWQKPPRFVLLVGDASFDPRNYSGFGSFDYLPTKLIDTALMETASDDWFVDFDGNGLPDIAIGRIPVHAVEDAQTVVSKILAYEQGSGTVQKEVVLVSDMNDDPSFDFEGASTSLESILPSNVSVQEVFRGRFGDDVQAHDALFARVDEGPLLVDYVGHGSIELWRGNLLDTGNDGEFTNGNHLPLFVNMTCLNGYFQAPNADSLAESLLNVKQGGALAVWASSGMTELEGQAAINKEIIRLLFDGESLTLGEAAMRAKSATDDPDVRKTWILFGDPTTKLKY